MVMEEDIRQFAMLGVVAALKVDSAYSRLVARHDLTNHPHGGGDHYSEKCFKEHGYSDWFADYNARMYGPKAACTVTQGETDFPTPSSHLCASDTLPG
ncbi:unnamed protein product, partial [Prunus brigantina]